MTLAELISIAEADSSFLKSMSSNDLWFGNNTNVRLTDAVADVARAAQGKADSNHTHTGYAASDHTHTGYAASDHTHTPASIGAASASHTHDYAASNHTHTPASIGAAASSHGHSYNDLSDKPTIPTIPESLPANGGNADTVDNKHASDFAAADHSHDGTYIAKALQMVADNGNVEYEMSGLDVLEVFEGMPIGLHTGYCPVNSTNAPLSNESWRFLMHKTGTNNYGWILAFGSYGSVYSNYVNGGTWRGWKNLVDGTSAPLWKHESNGGYYMTASQTVTPSKPLNQCRNGWVLLWSDYDPGTSTTNNADFCTTMIPKRNGIGALWSGQGFFCTVPVYMTESTDVDNFHIKKVYVHNDKLVGYVGNNVEDRRDAVLRAVYEY